MSKGLAGSGRAVAAGLLGWACLAMPVHADMVVETVDGQRVQAAWNGLPLLSPVQPALRPTGTSTREWYDPNTRTYSTATIPATEGGVLTIRNRQRQPVRLGPGKGTATRIGATVLYRMEYPAAETWWQVRFAPVDADGLDVLFELETAPEYWLGDCELTLARLALTDPLHDSGAISSWHRPHKTLDDLGPLGRLPVLSYPNGPNCFVPAAVLQDARLAVGICLLDAHRRLLPDYPELSLAADPGQDGLRVQLRFSANPFFGVRYQSRYRAHYRLRVAPPRAPDAHGRLTLLGAKDLWRDYLAELDQYTPARPPPPRDLSKNNLILMNFFMSEDWIRSADNPNGWVMAYPDWKSNPWEWRDKITPEMSDAEVRRRTGFGEAQFGKPVKWIQAYADKCVRELREVNATAMITWQAALNSSGNDTSYIPESHLFTPEMEETLAVPGPVREWDWVRLRLVVKDAAGAVVVDKGDAVVRAYDPESLIQLSQMARPFGAHQRLEVLPGDLGPAGPAYAAKAAQLGPRDRLTTRVAFKCQVLAPRARLLGAAVGAVVPLELRPLLTDPELAKAPLSATAEVLEVRRSAIDVWAKTLADAGQEFGFLVREDFTAGPPWAQWCQRFDWGADWQYRMVQQRIEWHRDRFGPACRWFYLDVFGNYTPPFVFAMLRTDFPDCFFFAEHPNDSAVRQVQGWNWETPMTDLERFVAPDGLVTVLPDRMLRGDAATQRAILQRVWRDPHCLLVTHRGAPALLKLMGEQPLSEAEAIKARNAEGDEPR